MKEKKPTMFMDKCQPLQYLIHNISDNWLREQLVSGEKQTNKQSCNSVNNQNRQGGRRSSSPGAPVGRMKVDKGLIYSFHSIKRP